MAKQFRPLKYFALWGCLHFEGVALAGVDTVLGVEGVTIGLLMAREESLILRTPRLSYVPRNGILTSLEKTRTMLRASVRLRTSRRLRTSMRLRASMRLRVSMG